MQFHVHILLPHPAEWEFETVKLPLWLTHSTGGVRRSMSLKIRVGGRFGQLGVISSLHVMTNSPSSKSTRIGSNLASLCTGPCFGSLTWSTRSWWCHFLWVGHDRFTHFKYFASAGLDAPWVADAGLVVAAALEIFALLFCAGSVIHFVKRREDMARTWFFVGVLLTLATFTFFSIGDHLFGDRFELLEHTLFWFITLVSWVAFTRLKDVHLPTLSQHKPVGMIVMAALLVLATSAVPPQHPFFHRRTSAVDAVQVGDRLYKVTFPFWVEVRSLRNHSVVEETHPGETIDHIYTVPNRCD